MMEREDEKWSFMMQVQAGGNGKHGLEF